VSIVIEVISVVVPLVHSELDNGVTLDNPDEFLNGVVKVQFDLNILRSYRLIARELKLLYKVLMRDLSETPTLISVEVDVVDIERSSLKRGNAEEGIRLGVDVDSAVSEGIGSDVALVLLSELKNDLNFMILESNQGERKTRVSAEPELEGDIKSSRLSLLEGSTSKSEGIANHIIITYLVSGLLGKLIPDIKPITVMFVA